MNEVIIEQRARELTVYVDDELLEGSHQVLVLDNDQDDPRMVIGQFYPDTQVLVVEERSDATRNARALGIDWLTGDQLALVHDVLDDRMLKAAIAQVR